MIDVDDGGRLSIVEKPFLGIYLEKEDTDSIILLMMPKLREIYISKVFIVKRIPSISREKFYIVILEGEGNTPCKGKTSYFFCVK